MVEIIVREEICCLQQIVRIGLISGCSTLLSDIAESWKITNDFVCSRGICVRIVRDLCSISDSSGNSFLWEWLVNWFCAEVVRVVQNNFSFLELIVFV